jgi:aryl-alcohol dehydrogenase-like predicted oxidoreductase
MRLSTAKDRDDARSLEVLRAGLDAGVELLDTADAYCVDDREVGHNERLLAQALADRAVFVVTKGGLVRPDGAWVPNGRARHLDAAARASRERLGKIDLYLLHVVDPKVPLATSVRALAKLRDQGIVGGIGLSNVGLHQLEQALAITTIDGVEVELGPYQLDAIRGGLLAACKQRGIRVLAHRPFGGPAGVKRIVRDEVVGQIAAKHGATPHEVVLAWLRRLGVVPLPGATRIETVRSVARRVELDADSAEQLDSHFVAIAEQPRLQVQAGDREVVIIIGMPAAGKTTLAHDFAARGYVRLNRDERGGTLLDLARVLDRELAAGAARVVLDNTYGTRALRAPVVEVATRHDVPVRCVVATTTLEQAQANAVARMLDLHGRLLEPAELRAHAMIGPSAQFRYRRDYEPPRADEGFASIEDIEFVTRSTAGEARRAIVVELDDVAWKGRPRSPADMQLVAGIRDHLRRWVEAGYVLAGTTWLTPASLDARLVELLDLPIAIARCAHPAGPPVCWCRKPLPGLALWLARQHCLDLSRSVHVGKGPADRGFAARAGLAYVDIAGGFPMPANSAS